MTHFLRNKENETIVDAEVVEDDLHVIVVIGTYSKFLLEETDPHARGEIIGDFDNLQELRGEYFEFEVLKKTPMTSDELVEKRMCEIAKKYDLAYVVD